MIIIDDNKNFISEKFLSDNILPFRKQRSAASNMKTLIVFALLFLSESSLINASKKKNIELLTSKDFEELPNGNIRFKTTVFDKNYHLLLNQAPNIFHKNFKLLSFELDKNKQPILKSVESKVATPVVFKDDFHNSVLQISKNKGKWNTEGILTPNLSIVKRSKNVHVAIKSKFSLIHPREKRSPSLSMSTPAQRISQNITSETVNPELLVIVDYKHAMTFKFSKQKIMDYLAVFWNAVNLRFATIEEPRVQLVLVGAVIINDKSLQPFIEKARVKTMVEYSDALIFLAQHVYKDVEKLPKFDIAVVMTGEDLGGEDADGEFSDLYTGIAIVGGACKWDHEKNITESVAIAEDKPPFYSGVLFHAHEIAHLLGAVHDGDPPQEHLPDSPGAQDCPFEHGYLMSYKLGTLNRVHWSNCTLEQIRWFLKTDQTKCLYSRQNQKTPIRLKNVFPGQLVSTHNQCSFYGPRATNYEKQNQYSICDNLYCDTGNWMNRLKNLGPALEGTECGYNKNRWCRNGLCVLKH